MRFLIVTPLVPPEPGGPSYYSVSLQEAFKKAGHEADLIAFKEVRQWPTGVRHLMFLYKVLLRALRADTLIILDTVSVALPAVLAGWVLGKKTIIRTGGDFVWEYYVERTGEKVVFRDFYESTHVLSRKERLLVWLQKHIVLLLATRVVYNSPLQRDVWCGVYKVSSERSGIVENAYPVAETVAKGGNNFVCAWRETTFKNVDFLVRAHEQARAQCDAAPLALLRGVPREEVHAALNDARALIIPSLTEFGPNLAMEAVSMGVPVILTKECGVHNRLNGHVTWIDPVDEAALAQTLCSFMIDKTVANARERAQSFAVQRTYDDVASDFIKLCDTL